MVVFQLLGKGVRTDSVVLPLSEASDQPVATRFPPRKGGGHMKEYLMYLRRASRTLRWLPPSISDLLFPMSAVAAWPFPTKLGPPVKWNIPAPVGGHTPPPKRQGSDGRMRLPLPEAEMARVPRTPR